MSDPQRPHYHFLPSAHWMNDPNGLIHWNDLYHLFYQYNPNGAWWGNIHWGHATSPDLVHWTELPIALAPIPGTADEDGCWSGCTVDDAGTPTILYTGSAGGKERPCLATGDTDLLTWRADPRNPVIPDPPPGIAVVGFRDPYLWREDGWWLMALGSGIAEVGGAVLLYRSRDLRAWEYLHPLCVGAAAQDGAMWECPNFFPLGDRHVLIVSVIPTREVVAYIGVYADGRFIPERRQLIDGGQSFYAPQVLRDAAGRTLMFGWLAEERSEAVQRAAGWSGALSLLRVLTLLPDGALGIAPAPEVTLLHDDGLALIQPPIPITAPIALPLDRRCEIALTLAPTQTLTLAHLTASNAPVQISYVHTTGELRLTTDGEAVRAMPLDLAPAEPLHLRIFLDGSVLEICANERAWLTARCYYEGAELPLLAMRDGE